MARKPALQRLLVPWIFALSLLWGRAAWAQALAVDVVEDGAARTVLRYRLGDFALVEVDVGGKPMRALHVDGARADLDEAGAPELPRVATSLAIAADGQLAATVLSARYHEVHDVDLAPSKGHLLRNVDPKTVPFSFGPAYQRDQAYPASIVTLGEPYILRDVRGVAVRLHPAQYNPVQRVLRVYDEVTVAIERVGSGGANVLVPGPAHPSRTFDGIYRRHFGNLAPPAPYPPLVEGEGMLIIADDGFLPAVAPLVDHKSSIGIATTAVGVSTIGNDPTAIHDYIAAQYAAGNLTYVLLVGDGAQVVSPQVLGGASDPTYSKLAGDDAYPEILVGRFSAETVHDVETQVARTIAYELAPATTQPWFKRAVGIGSAEGPGDDNEYDWQHIDNIRNALLGYGYTTVDQVYDPGAAASTVASALNQGRGLVNYTGHGWDAGWGTTGFSSTEVGQLTNVGALPFIFSVACVNGNFDKGTCFAEAWMRAESGGQPTGAVGAYMSSINQSWSPPMAAQDEANAMIVSESYTTFGALCFAGSGKMIDDYGQAGVDMFDTWIVFGDPSLRILGVVEPLTGLGVTPDTGFTTAGEVGGPFTPSETTYTLHNYSKASMDWTAGVDVPFLSVTPASGTLAAGAEATVTVSVADAATALAEGMYAATVSFVDATGHDGDTTRSGSVTVGHPAPVDEWPMDEDPGWAVEGQWAFGPPTGGGSGAPDPSTAHTGQNVYGYNLAGDYGDGIGEERLTTKPIDCSGLGQVSIKFWRWLGVLATDHASVAVSADGTEWITVWQSQGDVVDSAWTQQEIDLTAVAARQPAVLVRWTMGSTDAAGHLGGWNLDDVELWGVPAATCWDLDGDGHDDAECGGDDCDDASAAVHPGAAEVCTGGVDDDCNGLADDQDASCGGAGGNGAGAPGSATEAGEAMHGDCGCRAAGAATEARQTLAFAVALAAAAMARRRRRSARAS